MKNKILYFFILSMVFFSTCKKEEELPPAIEPTYGSVTAYIRGYVKDSATNLPLFGAIVNNTLLASNINGRYLISYSYNTNPKYQPPIAAITAVTNNEVGWIGLSIGNLIPNDTVTAPVIYAIPASFIKLHVKDTAMTTRASVSINCHYNSGFSGTASSFTDTLGHYTDTTFFVPISPRSLTDLNWHYSRGSFYNYHNLSFTLPASDTVSENIFY